VSESSLPPPSSKIPGNSGGNAPYILGVVVFVALIGGLICWKVKSGPSDAPPVTTPQATVKTSEPIDMSPPPPPPPKDEDTPDAAASAAPSGTGKSGGGTGSSLCTRCGDGKGSAALSSALHSAAQSVQGCYNRALRNSEVSGSMTVSVQVGANGGVCNASIVNDQVHSSDVASCVLAKFRGRPFPPPESGCVVVNIPISFAIKQ